MYLLLPLLDVAVAIAFSAAAAATGVSADLHLYSRRMFQADRNTVTMKGIKMIKD